MDTLSLVSEYLKDLEEYIDDGDSKITKEVKLFDALDHKSVVIEVDNKKITIFTKASLRAISEPFMRYLYSIPCKVDGQGAWDAKLDLAESTNYVTKEVSENMGFVYVNFSDYDRKMVNDVNVEIHGVKFKADFVVLDYVNEEEPSIVFGRDFLVTTKSQVNFGLGEIRINLTKFKEGIELIDLTKKVGSSSGEFIKMGNTNRNKSYNINKLTPPPSFLKARRNSTNLHCSTTTDIPSPNPKAKGENKRGKERLNKKEFSEDKVGIIEHGLPKKIYDPGNYVFPMKINCVVEMVALVDTRASVCVLPYSLYKDLGLGDPRPYQTNLTMADNTQAKAMGEVKNVRIQIGRGMLCIDDGVVRHTYFTKPRTKSYVEAFEMEGEDDWLGSFKVGRDEDGNVKYGLVAPSFIDIEDDTERALAMEAYFNPFRSERSFRVPRAFNWRLFESYGFKDTLREMMKLEYIYEGDGDYFDKDVDITKMMKEKCTWFRLCGHEHILTLFDFAVVLGLFTADEVEHHLFEIYFGKLEVDDKQFENKDYWTRVGKDYAKTVKNQSKAGNIRHEIKSLHQKPDQRAYFYKDQANKAKC
nr:hypothetical protein [Tanacetum cinerariifolium]